MSHELAENKVKTIVKLTKEGLLRPDIARQVGCSKQTVYKYQVKNGLM